MRAREASRGRRGAQHQAELFVLALREDPAGVQTLEAPRELARVRTLRELAMDLLARLRALLLRARRGETAQLALEELVDHDPPGDRALALVRAQRARADLGERGAQVFDVRALVGLDVAHHRRGARRVRRHLGIAEQL